MKVKLLIYRILHITPHLGGGIGSTVLGYLEENKTHEHTVVAFGYTLEWAEKRIKNLNIPYKDHITDKEVLDMIPNFDIVVIHAWNNPLLMSFLVRNKLPPCRLIIWGHVSGFFPPDVYTTKILLYPDLFIFTSPLSYNLPDVKTLPHIFSSSIGGALEIITDRHLRNKILYNIWSTGGTEKFRNIKKRKHKGFIVGYIGTVDYAKMHPDFLEMCKGIIDLDIPHLKFIVIGKTKEKELRAEVEKMGITEYFEILGWVESLREYLEIFDVFGYPLNPDHFGTCDLALQEAIASGTVPVVLDNAMEKSIVKNNKTGFVVKDKDEYVQAIKDMYNNINWRNELSNNARNDYDERFSVKRLDKEWNEVFDKIIKYPKTNKQWDINKKEIKAVDVFLESLGKYGSPFIHYYNSKNIEGKIFATKRIKELGKQARWQTTSKGTVHNYHLYYPDDEILKKWSELMK